MYKLIREKILPLLLQREISVGALSRLAGTSYKATKKALDGKKTSAQVIAKVAKALGVDYSEQPKYISREGV